MDEDFRVKNIGTPNQMPRRDYQALLEESRERNRRYEADRKERLKGRVHRPLFGAKICAAFTARIRMNSSKPVR